MDFFSRFRAELNKIGFVWLTPAWILLGIVGYRKNGFWLLATVPLFGLVGAWRRARKAVD